MKETYLLKLIKNCQELVFENLHLYYTSEISEEKIRFRCWNHYIEAYILSNLRLSYTLVPNFSMKDFDLKNKKAEMFLTSNAEEFKKILKECGMKWALGERLGESFGFVTGGIYTNYVSNEVINTYLPVGSYALDGDSHEFTHILIHYYLNTERNVFRKYCGSLIDEGIATLLNNQFRYLMKMRENLKKNKELDLNKISIENIREDGIMSIDHGYVEENFAYQYAALFTKIIDEKIRDTEKYKSNIPLSGLLSFIKEGIHKEKRDLYLDLKEEMDLDLLDIEKGMRKGLEMKDL